MLRLKQVFILIGVFVFLIIGQVGIVSAAPDGKLQVVASTTFFADLVKKVGGDYVEVKSVASPKFNVHFIQPKPSDVRNVSKADLFVFAGLDLEAWVDPLLEAAGKPRLFRGAERSVDLSQGMTLLNAPEGPLSRAHGDIHLFGNPHYTMDPENARIMARTLLGKFKEIDPDHAAVYEKNTADFLSRLDTKIIEWKALCANCAGKEIYSYHDDIVYFARFLGVKAEQCLEPKPGIPPGPRHLVFLEEHARSSSVRAIVFPTYYPRGTAEALSQKIGGVPVVTICQHVGEVSGTEDIFSFFETNIRNLSQALKG